MNIENIEFFAVVFVAFFLLLLSIIKQLSKQKLQQKIFALEEEVHSLKSQKETFSLQKQYQPVDTNLDLIKKVESLENQLDFEKKRVQHVKAIAQAANQVKSEFLTNIRHEVRTPMNSIIVFADLISQELKDVKLQSYAKNIISSSEHLLNLLDEIIKLSSVENGAFSIEENPVDIRSLLSSVTEDKRVLAERKGLALLLSIDEDVPESLMIDKEKVEEILSNLIANALQYTLKGQVNIHLYIEGRNIFKNSVNLFFEVKDTGIGIEEEYHGKIFEIFEKPHIDDELQGVGLTLSINKKMAQAMGGDLSVESTPKRGSVFTLALYNVEIALVSQNADDNEQEIDFSLIHAPHSRFVVIDMDTQSKNALQSAFSKTEIEIIEYDNPRDAIPFLQQQAVDIIFIDIDILTADENAVAKILTKISQAVIVTLTSHRLKDIHFYDSVPLVGHLHKPLVLSKLFTITLQALAYEQKVFLSDKKEGLEQKVESLGQGTLQERVAFLEEVEKTVTPLYEEALKTNNLALIEKFAKQLQQSSKKYNIEDIYSFSKILLEKIALFDIDKIHTMMQEYKEKIESLKNL